MKDVVVFLSAPRAATQWLVAVLSKYYSDLLVADHEPVGHAYRPDRYFRRPELLDEYSQLPEIAEHFARIEQIRRDKIYVEVGWHNYAAIPLFIRHFGQQVKVVHHVRHPVSNAASMVGARWYQGNLRADQQASIPEPIMPGTIHTGVAEHWQAMSPYAKSLFFWAEVNAHGLELERQLPATAFFRSSMEDILQCESGALRSLVDFLELPYRAEIEEAQSHRVDRWPRKAVVGFDWREITRHSEVVDLAKRLGYDLAEVNEARLSERFEPAMSFLVYPVYRYMMKQPRLLKIGRRVWSRCLRYRSLLRAR